VALVAVVGLTAGVVLHFQDCLGLVEAVVAHQQTALEIIIYVAVALVLLSLDMRSKGINHG
jgi:hypothetical protein